jgi:hypothetical protein
LETMIPLLPQNLTVNRLHRQNPIAGFSPPIDKLNLCI